MLILCDRWLQCEYRFLDSSAEVVEVAVRLADREGDERMDHRDSRRRQQTIEKWQHLYRWLELYGCVSGVNMLSMSRHWMCRHDLVLSVHLV